jgi:hypothetical protein
VFVLPSRDDVARSAARFNVKPPIGGSMARDQAVAACYYTHPPGGDRRRETDNDIEDGP